MPESDGGRTVLAAAPEVPDPSESPPAPDVMDKALEGAVGQVIDLVPNGLAYLCGDPRFGLSEKQRAEGVRAWASWIRHKYPGAQLEGLAALYVILWTASVVVPRLALLAKHWKASKRKPAKPSPAGNADAEPAADGDGDAEEYGDDDSGEGYDDGEPEE